MLFFYQNISFIHQMRIEQKNQLYYNSLYYYILILKTI